MDPIDVTITEEQPAALLSLPPELRMIIYDCVFADLAPVTQPISIRAFEPTALLQVCRQIRVETALQYHHALEAQHQLLLHKYSATQRPCSATIRGTDNLAIAFRRTLQGTDGSAGMLRMHILISRSRTRTTEMLISDVEKLNPKIRGKERLITIRGRPPP